MAEGSGHRGLPLLSGPAPSQPQQSDSCRRCGKEFNIIFSRSRKCNHCGYMYCHNCSDYQALMPRTGPDTGYDVMNVCGYCIDYLTITAGGRSHLKSLTIAKLRKYANAYNINITRAVEKDDIIDALINARTPNGCLPSAHENYYRRDSVPAVESRPGIRNMFRSSASHPPPPPPRDNNPPRHQQFHRPDLPSDLNRSPRPPPPPPHQTRPQPPSPPQPQPQVGSYPRQHQQGYHASPPPPPNQGYYARGHYGPPPSPSPRTHSSYNAPTPPSPSGGYPGQQWHQQQQPGWGQHLGHGYQQQPQAGFYGQPPGGSFHDAGAGGHYTPSGGHPPTPGPPPPPPPPPPQSSRPGAQHFSHPPPPPPRPSQPSANNSDSSFRGRTTSTPTPPVPTLDALLNMSAEEIKALSISGLKSILFTNHVNAGQVLEKGELVKKVEQLVEAERLERERAREREEMEEMERVQRELEREEEREQERQRARERERRQQQQEPDREDERERERQRESERRAWGETEERIHITRLSPVDGSDDEDDHSHSRQGSSTNADATASTSQMNAGIREEGKTVSKLAPHKPSPAAYYQERTGLCVICQDEEANIAIVDCGHLAMCRGCSDLVMNSSRECPLCRTRIVTEQRLLRIFKT